VLNILGPLLWEFFKAVKVLNELIF
jgi:hypothetical protein